MKLKSLDTLQQEAIVTPTEGMTKRQKLERWIALLEAKGDHRLATLWGVEYAPKQDRLPQRQDDSPIAVAYADPVLRAAGLKDDSYGAALEFFELGEERLHKLTCRCQFGSFVQAKRVARRLDGMINNPMSRAIDGARATFQALSARFA